MHYLSVNSLYNNNKNYYWKPTGDIIYSDRAISVKLYNPKKTNQRIICKWTKKTGEIHG